MIFRTHIGLECLILGHIVGVKLVQILTCTRLPLRVPLVTILGQCYDVGYSLLTDHKCAFQPCLRQQS